MRVALHYAVWCMAELARFLFALSFGETLAVSALCPGVVVPQPTPLLSNLSGCARLQEPVSLDLHVASQTAMVGRGGWKWYLYNIYMQGLCFT